MTDGFDIVSVIDLKPNGQAAADGNIPRCGDDRGFDARLFEGRFKAEHLLTGAESGNAENFIHGVHLLLPLSYSIPVRGRECILRNQPRKKDNLEGLKSISPLNRERNKNCYTQGVVVTTD